MLFEIRTSTVVTQRLGPYVARNYLDSLRFLMSLGAAFENKKKKQNKSNKQNVDNSSWGAFLFGGDSAEKSLMLKSFRAM